MIVDSNKATQETRQFIIDYIDKYIAIYNRQAHEPTKIRGVQEYSINAKEELEKMKQTLLLSWEEK